MADPLKDGSPTTTTEVTNSVQLTQVMGKLLEVGSSSTSSIITALTSIASAITASLIGGSTGTTANRVLRAKGTTGRALQNSAVTIDDSGNVTGIADLTGSGTDKFADAILTNRTAYAVLCGGTTSANVLQSIASVGSAGQVLTSNGAGALPTMQTPTTVNVQTFNVDGTWTKPAGTVALIQCWGGGASGGRAGAGDGGGGGGGGTYIERLMLLSDLAGTVAVTIGAGGPAQTADNTNGTAGGDTTFGAHVTAYGGGAGSGTGTDNGGGGGGGIRSAGSNAAGTSGGGGGWPPSRSLTTSDGLTSADMGASIAGFGGNPNVYGGGGGSSANNSSGGDSVWGGGGGGWGSAGGSPGEGGPSVWGGGGGGGGADTSAGAAGGTSLFGGAGGAGATGTSAATAGSAPGGGGGGSEQANSGAGANGRVIVITW